MTKVWRILLVDDHALFRDGIRRILDDVPGLSVVAEAGCAAEGLSLAREQAPDLVLLDISLPDQSGLDLLQQLREVLPKGKLLVLSMHRRPENIVRSFKAGANGYVPKDSALGNLLTGINSVLGGDVYLDPSISQDVLSILFDSKQQSIFVDAQYSRLTHREQEVIRLIAEGRSAKSIGEQLGISPKTVDCHRANIMRKLALESTVDIIRYAARLRLIDLTSWRAFP